MPNNTKKKMYIYKNGRYIVPETPDLEGIINDAIEADKDILSQIEVEYDEDSNSTSFTFPENILPLAFYVDSFGDTFYFDYSSSNVVGNNGYIYGSIELLNNKIILVIDDSELFLTEGYDNLAYIISNATDNFPTINTIILSPYAQEPGTKLYKHSLRFTETDGGEDTTYTIDVITLFHTAITSSSFFDIRDQVIAIIGTGNHGTPLYFYSPNGDGDWYLKQQDSYYDDLFGDHLYYFKSDTVTEL